MSFPVVVGVVCVWCVAVVRLTSKYENRLSSSALCISMIDSVRVRVCVVRCMHVRACVHLAKMSATLIANACTCMSTSREEIVGTFHIRIFSASAYNTMKI